MNCPAFWSLDEGEDLQMIIAMFEMLLYVVIF